MKVVFACSGTEKISVRVTNYELGTRTVIYLGTRTKTKLVTGTHLKSVTGTR